MMGFEDPELLRVRGSDLQILEYYRIKSHQQLAELRNWFLNEMRAPDEALRDSAIHTALAQLTNCDLFYTTNYDDFIERSLGLHGRMAYPVAVESHIASAMKKKASGTVADAVEIVKFHGDLSNPERMVLSESDYERRLKLAEVEDQRLLSDVLGRAILFLGYSFRDWNVSYLFRIVNDQFGPLPLAATGRRAYIVVADPSDFEAELFRARNIEVIPIRSSHRTEDTVKIIEGLADA
ncbi:SIR2 family NAD-dependent protein deacylase [Mycolicibacterium rutilum]|nr:SIR2 family protein [Mycolicibacterium rutilum]